MDLFTKLARIFQQSMLRSMEEVEEEIPIIGIVGVVGLLLYFYIWTVVFPQDYDNLSMRLFGAFLCLGLVFKNRWPARLNKYFPWWFYFTAWYTLPFFSTFLLLKNDYATVALMVSMMSLFLLILLVDWLSLNVLFFGGVLSAIGLYQLVEINPDPPYEYLPYLSVYLFTIVAGSVFKYKSSLMQRKKLEGMTMVSGSIAHELRTPLLGIKSGAAGLQRYFPALFAGYQQAKEAGLDVPTIRESHYTNLFPVIERIEKETLYANSIIDMLLMNVGNIGPEHQLSENCSMMECVATALERYPFQSEQERRLIHVDHCDDFYFKGSQILVVHVLFNLLKNALYFIAEAGKGEIFISEHNHKSYNELHFTDTGPGISPKVLPYLFNRFYTTTSVGTGIGLSFCKLVMEGLGGKITCQSQQGHFTKFVLRFPQMTSQ